MAQPAAAVGAPWQYRIGRRRPDNNARAGNNGMFHADLHIHSRFSRACSRDCDLEHLAWWARRKGITVVGTGDFTHPAWRDELRESLIPAEPGLFRLSRDAEDRLRRKAPASCAGEVRFMLSAEISTIYRGGERTRKVHHLLYAPTFQAADRISAALSKIGNLASDGRPILGLDSRHLLEITLEGGPGCYLVPAHAWTPWFAVLGSKSGFDAVADCYGDLAGHIFAIETGLSSDPAMNWRCSSLDAYRLVSNSDAHSPPMLGREATTFDVPVDYFAMADAMRTGNGLAGTIEFYPEEGKYHLDGHRKCGIRFEPAQSREHQGRCPECGKPLTIGVLHRVAELADRPAGYRPAFVPGFTNLVQLPQIVGEIMATGPKSKRVGAEVDRLVAALGPELSILTDADAGDLRRAGGGLLAEAVARLRRGDVRREAGYDGEYGVISLFAPGELNRSDALFDLAAAPEPAADEAGEPAVARGGPAAAAGGGAGATGRRATPGAAGRGKAGARAPGAAPAPGLGDLDPDQRAAARAGSPLMIIAGPGTGKTRTLTHRIAAEAARRRADARPALAITFTRRAAEEMRARLAALVPPPVPAARVPLDDARATPAQADGAGVTVTTFHGLGLMILREQHERAGLGAGFQVADEAAVLELAAELAGSGPDGRRLLAEAAGDPAARELLVKALAARDLVDFDGLIELPAALLAADPGLAASLRERWPLISVDEYQDIDAGQYRLLRLLAGDGRGLTVIGDPDQAIYGFRGADVGLFLRFADDFPGATTRQLTRNYRSARVIVAAARQAIAPSSLVPGRVLRPSATDAGDAPGTPRSRAAASAWQTTAAALIGFHEAADERAEAAWVAREIERLLGGASFHALDTGRAAGHGHDGLGLSDVAVLYRTDAQAEPLGQALTRAGLPFQKGSHDLLERRTGVPEIVREMRLADGTGPDAPGPAAVSDRLRAAVRRLAARAGGGGAAVDVRGAGEVLAPLARRCGSDLERFLTEISLGAETDALDPRADAVTLLTLHAAKGLEFEVVFLAGCEKDLLPLRVPGRGPASGPELAEERRLLFVGITRARARLFLTCAARRTRHGSTRDTGPSPFLAAIEPALLDRSAGRAGPARPPGRQLRLL
jgi:DNA helicase II / ATP-dependent DNA helicase PcrA